jgi:hypothetical protein
MNTHVYKMICLMVLLLSAWTSQTATTSSPLPTATPIPPTAVTASETAPVEVAPQTGAATTRDKVGLILGNLLILSLWSFPMSIGEGWAFGDLKPPRWVKKPHRVAVGLVAGGCLMAVVVVVGVVAFALYYLFSGQPETVNQILPRFAYWFPFALLGLVTDVPFKVFDLEDKRLRVLLRLIIFWFPRLVIVAFMINLPILQDLDPVTTALVVLAIDGVLTAFFLWLYTSREQIGMKDVQQDYDTYEDEIA